MNKENAAKVVQALRSGGYKQLRQSFDEIADALAREAGLEESRNE